MATFEFKDESGTYHIDAPDEQAAVAAWNSAQGNSQPRGSDAPVTLGGIGRTVASIPAHIAASTLGMPGDLLDMGKRLLGDNLSGPTQFGSQGIKDAISRNIAPVHEAQNAVERPIQKFGELLPFAFGGPGGAVAKIGLGAALPAVTGEAARQAASGTGYEGLADAAGTMAPLVAGPAAFNAFMRSRAAAASAPRALTGEELVRSGSNQFDAARGMDLVAKPDFAAKTASDMRSALKDFDPLDASQKDVFRKIDLVENLGRSKAPELTAQQRLELEMNGLPIPKAEPPKPFAMNELENIRKQLSKLKTSPDGATREAARAAQEAITKNQMALSAADIVSGDGAKYAKTMRNAVGDYAAGKRMQTLEGKMNLAELNLNSPVGGLDMASHGQALQRTMKQLARPMNNTNVPVAKKLGFNSDEVAAITNAANGNILTHLGDVANQIVPHWAGGGAAASVLRAIGGLSVKRQVAALNSLISSRSPLAAQIASQLPPQIVAQLPTKTQRILQSLALAQSALKPAQPVNAGGQY